MLQLRVKCLGLSPDQDFGQLSAELVRNHASDIQLFIISDEQSSELLDRRYQGILPGIGETYLRMPAESSKPTDELSGLDRMTIMPEPSIPAAHQADQGASQDSSSSTAAQCSDRSDRNFAALLIRMSAAESSAPDQMAHVPPDSARAESVALDPHAWQNKLASPSRARILIMALLAVAVLELGLLISTMRRPVPAALTVQAQSPGTLVATRPGTPVPLVREQSTPSPVDGGQPASLQAVPDRAGPPHPQPVPGMEKPPAIAQMEPLPQVHHGDAENPAPPASMARTIPRVYFHVGSEVDRQRVSAMAPALRQHGMELVGIKIVSNGPSKPDIRYFHDNEREEALRVRKALLSVGFPVHQLKHIGGMETRATPRLYEVWIMPGPGG